MQQLAYFDLSDKQTLSSYDNEATLTASFSELLYLKQQAEATASFFLQS